jgi:hypothetical protein
LIRILSKSIDLFMVCCDAGLASPTHEQHLVEGPSRAPIGQGAQEYSHRPGDQDEDGERPDERRQSPIAISIRRAVGLHFLGAELPQDSGRQPLLHKEVFVEHQALAPCRAKRAKALLALARAVRPPPQHDDGLRVCERPDLTRMATSAVMPIGAPQSWTRERHLLSVATRQTKHVARLIDETIGLVRRLAGPPHPDKIRGQQRA